jgi:MFS family permease
MQRIVGIARAIAVVLVLKVLESYCDFVTSLNLSLYLSNVLGFSDVDAGVIYGIWGIATSAFGIVLGSSIDSLGVRRALLIGGAFSLAGRLLFVATSMQELAGVSLFVLQSIGAALSIPVLSIAVRQLLEPEQLALAFSLFYMAMQVGAIGSGLITDTLRGRTTHALPMLMWSTPFVTLVYLALVWFYFPRESLVLYEKTPAVNTCLRDARATCSDRVLWRLVLFSLALTGSCAVWRHLDVSMPKYIIRTLGVHARYGDVYAINPFVVLTSVTLVQSLLAKYDAYDVIVAGTLVTALSPLVLYFAARTYVALAAFMLVLSLGEIIYSPRVYEFMLQLAPRGREGVYSALASAPLFVIRFATGASSGFLLARYCPAPVAGTDLLVHGGHCQTLWVLVSLAALTTPLSLMLLRRCIYSKEIQRKVNVYAITTGAPSDDDVAFDDIEACTSAVTSKKSAEASQHDT